MAPPSPAVLKCGSSDHTGLFTPFVLRPMEAGVTAQADDVLGSDPFGLLLPNIPPDPFEPCFRSPLNACAHCSPSRDVSTGVVAVLRGVPWPPGVLSS